MPFGADPYGVFQVKLYLTSPVLFITSILLKRISGLGDRLAVSIMMAVPHEELFSPETARRAARLLRGAFASAHVECEIDRVPRVSLYLLDLWLARLEDPEVKREVAGVAAELRRLAAELDTGSAVLPEGPG